MNKRQHLPMNSAIAEVLKEYAILLEIHEK